MKKYFKLFFTLKPPFGEIWLVMIIVSLLLLVRQIELDTALGWLFSAAFLASIFIVGYVLHSLFKRYF